MKYQLKRSGRALVFLFLALFLAGCGTDQQAASQATPQTVVEALATATVLAGQEASNSTSGIDMSKVDACALLSQADIEAVMGPVTYDPHPYSSQGAEQKLCIYVATVEEDGDKVEGKSVSLVVWPASEWETLKTARGGSVSGIGDEAVTSDLGPTGLALWILVQNRAVVHVEVFPKDIENAKKLALKVIEHLP